MATTTLYDDLIRLGLKPGQEFEFQHKTDTLMRIRNTGVRKLVDKRFYVTKRNLHVSMIPDELGVVDTALISAADDRKRPGFWHVILDATGRPVAEHPLTYSTRKVKPTAMPTGNESDHPPSGKGAVLPEVPTTGDLTRMLVSWLVGQDRINDGDSAILLEILSVHADSPRNVKLEVKTRSIAQRLHDELVCFEEDAVGIADAVEQAAKLRAKLFPAIKEFPV